MTITPRDLRNAVALLFTLALLIATPLLAQQCSTRTTEGRYLVVCDGYLTLGPNAPLAPAKLLAAATADANGTFRGTDGILSLGGVQLRQSVVGTEDIHSDCSGTITYTETIDGQPGPPLNFAFVVSENGNKIDGIGTDPGTVFACRLTRIAPE